MAIEKRNSQTMTAEELQARIDGAKPGSTIQLGPGRVRGRIVIDKPLTIRGAGADRTTIDGTGKGSTICIDATDGDVHIEELTVTGGRSSHGAGISIDNGARVHLLGLTIMRNTAKSGSGGAVAIDRGELYVNECTIVQNRAYEGGAIYIGGEAKGELSASIVAENAAVRGGAIAVIDGAQLDVWTSRILDNGAEYEGHHLFARGSLENRPHIVLSNTLLSAADAAGIPIANDVLFSAQIVVDNSTLGRERLPAVVLG
jgi:hypothetical protein